MCWACCESGWRKDSKEITGRQTGRREKNTKTQIKVENGWMDDVFDLKGIRVWKDGDQELWTEQDGHLSSGKPRPNFKTRSAKYYYYYYYY
jgi:hypothetical protein